MKKDRWPAWARDDVLISMLIDEIEVMLCDLVSSQDARDKITADSLIRELTDLDVDKPHLYEKLFDLCMKYNSDMLTRVW